MPDDLITMFHTQLAPNLCYILLIVVGLISVALNFIVAPFQEYGEFLCDPFTFFAEDTKLTSIDQKKYGTNLV